MMPLLHRGRLLFWAALILMVIGASPTLVMALDLSLASRATAHHVMAFQRLGLAPQTEGASTNSGESIERSRITYATSRSQLTRGILPQDSDPKSLIQGYLNAGFFPTPVIDQTIAGAFSERAQAAFAAGRDEEAFALLEAVLLLHPGDLYAAGQLWQRQPTEELEQMLHYPSAAAITLYGRALGASAVEGVLALDESGLWSAEQTKRIVANWVWRYANLPALHRLLETLSERYPNDATWPFLMGEYFQRSGETARSYPAYERAYRLGDTGEETLRRLILTGEAIGVNVSEWQNDAQVEEAGATGETFIADRIGVTSSQVGLGPDQVGGGGFEDEASGATLDYWRLNQMADGVSWGEGLFIGGRDIFMPAAGEIAGRIDGLWQGDPVDSVPASAGFQLEGVIPIAPSQAFLVDLRYRSSGRAESSNAAVNLGGTFAVLASEGIEWGDEVRLPGAGNGWQREFLLVINPAEEEQTMRLLLRNWGTGSVWFDEVTIRQVYIDQSGFNFKMWLEEFNE